MGGHLPNEAAALRAVAMSAPCARAADTLDRRYWRIVESRGRTWSVCLTINR